MANETTTTTAANAIQTQINRQIYLILLEMAHHCGKQQEVTEILRAIQEQWCQNFSCLILIKWGELCLATGFETELPY